MKKSIISAVAVVVLLLAGWGGWFFYTQLRGAGPAVLPPSKEKSATSDSSTRHQTKGINSTGLPLSLPAGFSIREYAGGLGNARVLAWDQSGNLHVSQPGRGSVAALLDSDGDGTADEIRTVVSGLNRPHGLAFREAQLYIAETDRIAVYDYNSSTVTAVNKKKIADLPGGGNHFTRTIGFGPDGRLYTSVGSTCNVCHEKDIRRTKILVSQADGSGQTEFASGLRNAVFFRWHPVTGELWATEMGRDLLGDNIPPDEINIIKPGGFYGWPYCYGKNTHDTSFDASARSREICLEAAPSYIDIPAHSAPLGLVFVPPGAGWPDEYDNNLLVALHGSWNRSDPTGYKVVRYRLDQQGKYLGEEDFLTGFLTAGGAAGRPVDLLFDANGKLYISDDKAGAVYRMSYQEGN